MPVHDSASAYRQYLDQIVQELRQPQHARYLLANLTAGDWRSFEKYCRHFIDDLTGPHLENIRRRLHTDVPLVLREYLRDDRESGPYPFM